MSGEFERKNSLRMAEFWSNLKPILLGTIFLALIFIPAIMPNFLLHLVSFPNVYVYHKLEASDGNDRQELLILQVTKTADGGRRQYPLQVPGSWE